MPTQAPRKSSSTPRKAAARKVAAPAPAPPRRVTATALPPKPTPPAAGPVLGWVPAPAQATAAQPLVRPRPVAGLGRALVLLLAASLTFGLLNLILLLAVRPSLGVLVALGAVSALVSIPTIIVFCIWLHHILANAKARYPEAGIQPGWAVGSFFIPFVQLVAPYLAIRPAWRADLRKGEGLLATWFVAWSLGIVVAMVVAIVGAVANAGVLLDTDARPGTDAYAEAQDEAREAQFDAQRPLQPVAFLLQAVAGVALMLVARQWSSWQDPPAS